MAESITGYLYGLIQSLQSSISGLTGAAQVYHLNLPDNPNDTLEYRGWVPAAYTLNSVRAYMGTVNNQGTFTLDVRNNHTGNSCLSGGVTFDMNGLTPDDVTDVPLTATSADLDFDPTLTDGRWTILLVSDDIAFNGQDIYIELVFGVP